VAVDDGEEAPRGLAVVAGRAEERLRVALDGGEGSPQLVRDVGDEVAADHLEAS
jgi:hypothetical protein